ncbi:MAG: hypothetical protein JWO53_91 [Chlamydiia bacterium]|nr:hypothetical protein [Chlamydiia bacterium]
MIEVSPDTACMIYLGSAIIALITIWLYQHKYSKKSEKSSFSTKHFSCEFCHATYLDNPVKPFTRCPECQSLNKNTG